jgi:DNA polymerase I-like protein with 3'-5' exonuclease and polymerase domains
LDNAAKRKGPNACVQGFCADQLKYTLPQVKRYLQEINSKYSVANKIVALVHDEIVYELEETMAYEVGEHLRNMMQDIQGEMLYRYFKCETGGFSSLTIANCWKK